MEEDTFHLESAINLSVNANADEAPDEKALRGAGPNLRKVRTLDPARLSGAARV